MRLAWGEGEAWRESAGGAAGDLREVCGTEVRGVPYGDGGAGGARCTLCTLRSTARYYRVCRAVWLKCIILSLIYYIYAVPHVVRESARVLYCIYYRYPWQSSYFSL